MPKFVIKKGLNAAEMSRVERVKRKAKQWIVDEEAIQRILGTPENQIKEEIIQSTLSQFNIWRNIYNNHKLHSALNEKTIAITVMESCQVALKMLGVHRINIPNFTR